MTKAEEIQHLIALKAAYRENMGRLKGIPAKRVRTDVVSETVWRKTLALAIELDMAPEVYVDRVFALWKSKIPINANNIGGAHARRLFDKHAEMAAEAALDEEQLFKYESAEQEIKWLIKECLMRLKGMFNDVRFNPSALDYFLTQGCPDPPWVAFIHSEGHFAIAERYEKELVAFFTANPEQRQLLVAKTPKPYLREFLEKHNIPTA